jgi:cell division protein FtsB
MEKREPAPMTRLQRRKAVRRRQVRLLTLVCLAISALVLVTSFPATALLRQRSDVSSANSELQRLTSENKDLQSQANELSMPNNIENLARRDYDMVKPGQKLYDVLPSSSASSSTASSGSSSLNQRAVSPGSNESQELIGDGDSTGTQPATSLRVGSEKATVQGPNLWGRVLNSLEFWR